MKTLDEIEKAVEDVRKKFGDESIVRMGTMTQRKVDVVRTGSLALDAATGIGGFPRGRIVEVYGPESSGKTTLALHAIANAQRSGGFAAVIDAEHALDMDYAKNLGVDVKNLYLSQPDFGEQGLEIADALIRSGRMSVILIDSVAALVPKAEIEGDMGDHHVGVHARLMSQALRKMTGIASQTNTLVIFINQLRSKIGVMFGSPETTTGGNALKFYASMRLDVRKRDPVKEAGKGKEDKEATQIGNITEVKIVKNKLAPPFRTARFEIHYGKGIDKYGDLLSMGMETGVVAKSGAWFSFGEERIGQGFYNAAKFIEDHPDVEQKISSAIRKKAV